MTVLGARVVSTKRYGSSPPRWEVIVVSVTFNDDSLAEIRIGVISPRETMGLMY